MKHKKRWQKCEKSKSKSNPKLKTQLTVSFFPEFKLRPFFTCPPDWINLADFISSSTLGPIFNVTDSLASRTWSCRPSGVDTGTPFTSNITSPVCRSACRSIIPPARMRATTSWLCSSTSTVKPSGSFGLRRNPTMRIVSAPGISFSLIFHKSFVSCVADDSLGVAVTAFNERSPISSCVSINALMCGLLSMRANSRASVCRSRLYLWTRSRHKCVFSNWMGRSGSPTSSNVLSWIYAPFIHVRVRRLTWKQTICNENRVLDMEQSDPTKEAIIFNYTELCILSNIRYCLLRTRTWWHSWMVRVLLRANGNRITAASSVWMNNNHIHSKLAIANVLFFSFFFFRFKCQ